MDDQVRTEDLLEDVFSEMGETMRETQERLEELAQEALGYVQALASAAGEDREG